MWEKLVRSKIFETQHLTPLSHTGNMSMRVKDKRKLGLKIEPVWHAHIGLYRVHVSNPDTKAVTTATTELKFDYNHYPEFQALDVEREGLISKDMMIESMCATDTYLTEKEIRKFIKNSDCMKADQVNYNEYVRYIKFAKRNSIRPVGRELIVDEEPKKEDEGNKEEDGNKEEEGNKEEGTDKKDKGKKKGDGGNGD